MVALMLQDLCKSYVIAMFCESYMNHMRLVYESHVTLMRLLCESYVIFIWILCESYVIVMWILCDFYLNLMWILCDAMGITCESNVIVAWCMSYVYLALCLGQHDDARMCLAIALTAARLGASIANHCEVLELIKHKEENGKTTLSGARVRDRLTGRTNWPEAGHLQQKLVSGHLLWSWSYSKAHRILSPLTSECFSPSFERVLTDWSYMAEAALTNYIIYIF